MVGSAEYPVPEITEEEIERAVRKMKSNKAAGVSEVSIGGEIRGPMDGSVVREDTG